MNLIHTNEEIKVLCNDYTLATELIGLSKRFSRPDLHAMAIELLKHYDEELDCYKQFIGYQCYAPPSPLATNKEWRLGTIKKITNFNSVDVRVDFEYMIGGHDNHSLTQLTFNGI